MVFFQVLKLYSLPILSSVLIGTSYMPFPPWAVFFGYVPLWLFSLKQKQLKSVLLGGWICQFFMTLIGFNWIGYTIKEFGFVSWPLAMIGLFFFASLAHLHIPIALCLWFYSKKILKKCCNQYIIWLLLPIYFGLSTHYYPFMFKWHLGYTWFYINLPAAQTAEIWGFQFIHTLILLSNFAFLFIFKNYKNKQALIMFCAWLTCFSFLQLWGGHLKNQWPNPDKKAQVLIIQPNIKNNLPRNKSPATLTKLIALTSPHLNNNPNIDFIIWPEGAYPYTIDHLFLKRSNQKTSLEKTIRSFNTPLILNTHGIHPQGPTNSIFVFNKNGKLVQGPYNKRILLAFGEYLPGEKWFPIKKYLPYYTRSFYRGTGENKIIHLNGINIGLQNCYEGLFDYLSRELAQEGANILVNLTNDSWYGDWQQPWQHLYMTLARAIEVRRTLVRGTNSGLSRVVSAKGDILSSSSEINTSWSKIEEVPYSTQQNKTIFTSWGYYINIVFLWITWFFIMLNWMKVVIIRLKVNTPVQ